MMEDWQVCCVAFCRWNITSWTTYHSGDSSRRPAGSIRFHRYSWEVSTICLKCPFDCRHASTRYRSVISHLAPRPPLLAVSFRRPHLPSFISPFSSRCWHHHSGTNDPARPPRRHHQTCTHLLTSFSSAAVEPHSTGTTHPTCIISLHPCSTSQTSSKG